MCLCLCSYARVCVCVLCACMLMQRECTARQSSGERRESNGTTTPTHSHTFTNLLSAWFRTRMQNSMLHAVCTNIVNVDVDVSPSAKTTGGLFVHRTCRLAGLLLAIPMREFVRCNLLVRSLKCLKRFLNRACVMYSVWWGF